MMTASVGNQKRHPSCTVPGTDRNQELSIRKPRDWKISGGECSGTPAEDRFFITELPGGYLYRSLESGQCIYVRRKPA